jgi:phosphatidylglycerophosphate synthase
MDCVSIQISIYGSNLQLTYRPNLITLAGFLCNVIPTIMLPLLYGSDLEGEMSAWFLTMCGIAFFVYMICDNCDGKQARRTGSSSPLGMLFDHGADCLTSLINTFFI